MNAVLIIFILIRLGVTLGYWKLFEKAGIDGWKSLIPFYSEYIIMVDIVGKPKWWFVYLLVPVVNSFAWYVLIFNLLRCFGKETLWGQILVIFAAPLYLPYLGFRKDVKYQGKLDDLPEIKKTPVQEWADAIIFAVVAATLIRWLIMEAYTIPTPSMEQSLLVGDFLFVSKFHYGTRTTTTPIQIPLTHQKIWFTEIPSYLEWIRLPQYRLPGISKIKCDDVVVFNVPPLDLNEGRSYPVDLKTNYIKRCVAIAGDTLRIENRQVIVNGIPEKNPPLMQFNYLVTANSDINERILKKYKIYDSRVVGRPGDGVIYHMFLTQELADELSKLNFIRDVRIATSSGNTKTEKTVDPNIFPDAKLFPWNGDFFGPLVIPREGMTIVIDDSTLATYGSTIIQYDHNDRATIENGKLYINGNEVTQYTFKQNYYFMMGDNRHNSLDSRYWGFVPEDHIVGKAFFIWLSIDRNANFINKIRWSRFFKLIE